ncbi:hypothetical protein [Nonomuraea sp. SBT364]|uniref:hypothetical protein n=1 Tax=Nonomuraea sp. SBT364 TaxID=1580530 RepID=UPI0012E27A1A|nr:hypothetical protein [Nonomuraea sp. SBT364]
MYVLRRIDGLALPQVAAIARRIVDEYGDDYLETLLTRLGARSVQGEFRNLIFAANGPKPKIILSDAVNNVLEIIKNEQHCLVYHQPLQPSGLTWRDLVAWWAEKTDRPADDIETAASLFRRLSASLASPAEERLFNAYGYLYRMSGGWDLPALIPQVYLHYTPYTQKWIQQLGQGKAIRQRMDFLLLLPHQARVVIEVDGAHHYSKDGRANTHLYAEMVSEDRRLRLAGYDLYRFGGAELTPEDRDGSDSASITTMLWDFFISLFERHEIPFSIPSQHSQP